MTRELKLWRAIQFSLLGIQIGLLVGIIMTPADENWKFLIPIIGIAALLVSIKYDESDESEG